LQEEIIAAHNGPRALRCRCIKTQLAHFIKVHGTTSAAAKFPLQRNVCHDCGQAVLANTIR